jgi:predicted  nucleic acid-binding Zn-ribbon protein
MKSLTFLHLNLAATPKILSDNGLQSAKEWSGRIIRSLQTMSDTLGRHPHVAMTVIVVANTIFYLALNYVIRRVESPVTEGGEPSSLNHKKILVHEGAGAVSVLAFNILLSKATQAHLDGQSLAAFTAVSVVLRIFFRLILNRHETPSAPQKPISPPAKAALSDEVLSESPAKTEDQPEPAKPGIDLLKLKAELAKEKARADQTQAQESKHLARITEMEVEIAELEQKTAATEKEKDDAETLKDLAEKQVVRLTQDNEGLSAQINSLGTQILNLEDQKKKTESAKAQAERDLKNREAAFSADKSQLNKTIADLKDQEGSVRKDLAKAKDDAAKAAAALQGRIKTLEAEKQGAEKDATSAKDTLAKEQKRFQDELQDANAQKVKAEDEKRRLAGLLTDKEQDLKAAQAAEKAAKQEEEIATREKKTAYSQIFKLEAQVQELEAKLAARPDPVDDDAAGGKPAGAATSRGRSLSVGQVDSPGKVYAGKKKVKKK